MGWQDWIFGNLPLQPVLGDQVGPGYQQMPSATNIEDRRAAAGPAQWASRPHDQDLQSRNMSGFYKAPSIDAIDWQKSHGWLGRHPPTAPLSDPDFIPLDPSIMARIKAAGAQGSIGPQQMQNALQLWMGSQ
jgi:hypothetical protein